MTHDEYCGSRVLHCPVVELERTAVKPAGPRLLVVVEAEPGVGKLADPSVVLAPPQIDDVGYPEGAKSFGVDLGLYRATERQPLADENYFQLNCPSPSEKAGLGV
jgi:hypothetical protein